MEEEILVNSEVPVLKAAEDAAIDADPINKVTAIFYFVAVKESL